MQAELVALGVAHNVGNRATIGLRIDVLRAQSYQPLDLGFLAVSVDVKVDVHAILGDLGFGNTLEEEPGFSTGRVAARGDVPERGTPVDHHPLVRGQATVSNQLINQR